MKPVCLVFLLTVLLFGRTGQAQTLFCGSDIFWQDALSTDSSLAFLRLARESAAYQLLSQNAGVQAARSVLTVPVVFHLLHDNGPENLSDSQVQQAVQRLNDAFANTAYYDQGSGADVQIRFCLATRAPDGSATGGINRVQTPLTELTLETQDGLAKSLSRWAPTRYVNIWVVRSICSTAWGCGVVGYATQPFFHGALIDGLVLEAGYVGGAPTSSSPLIHEMGHYLGLYHTFEGGCTNNDCLADGDRVCDTPPDQSVAGLPCDQQANSCTTDTQSGLATDLPDDTKNFMDYGNLACLHDFTPGQGARMNFFLQNDRASLLDSDGCGAPCPALVTAAFDAGASLVDIGASLTLSNQSQHAASFTWAINGQVFSSAENPTYVFDNEGVYTISLTAASADPALCPSQSATAVIQVQCPVTADFLASSVQVNTGQTVSFVNNSQNASAYEWFVNGVSQGPALPAYTFTEAGSYFIRLEARNGLCERAKTLVVIVQDSCQGLTFQQVFGTAADERGTASLAFPDGSLLLGGDGETPDAGREVLLIRTDADGNVLWTRHFGSPDADEHLQDLAPVASGGFVALFTSRAGAGSRDAGLAGFSADGTLLWQRRMVAPGDEELRRLRPAGGGGYLAAGFAQPPGAGELPRAYFVRFDAAGNTLLSWSVGVPQHHTFATDIAAMGDTAIVAAGYYFASDSVRRPLMLQFQPNGGLIAARTYAQTGLTDIALWNIQLQAGTLVNFYGEAWNLNETPPVRVGFSLVNNNFNSANGNTTLYTSNDGRDVAFTDVARNENDLLNAAANDPGAAGPQEAALYLNDDRIKFQAGLGDSRVSRVLALPGGYLFTGESRGADGDRQMFWIKTGATGLAGACAAMPASSVSFLNAVEPAPPVAVTPGEVFPWQNELAFSVQPYSLPAANTCPPDCGAAPCKDVWWEQFLDAVAQNAPSAIVAAPDGSFYIGGQRGTRTLLLNLAADGSLLWARSFDFASRQDRLFDLNLDSEGMLVGVGRSEQSNLAFAGFVFKYDPVANAVLWVKEEALEKRSQFTHVLEKTPGGNYLVQGYYPTGQASAPDLDPVLLELDRNTGELAATGIQFGLDVDQNETFRAIKKYGDAWFCVGEIHAPSESVVCKFGADGSLSWSRILLFPGDSTPYGLEAVDLAFYDDAMYVALQGLFVGLSTVEYRMILVKMTVDGEVLWSRWYNPQEGFISQYDLLNITASASGITFLLRNAVLQTDLDGHPRWNWLASNNEFTAQNGRRMLLEQNGYLYLIGQTPGAAGSSSANALSVMRVKSANGDLSQICNPLDVFILDDGADTVVTEPFDLLVYPNPLTLETRQAAPEPVFIGEPALICGAPCLEICGNGVSDDYDGEVDCFDVDCYCPGCAGEKAHIWYFGYHAGLDFSADPPAVLADGATDSPGASAVLCDGGGNLLLYTDGQTIFNRNHQPVPDGSGLSGDGLALNTLLLPYDASRFFAITPQNMPFDQRYTALNVLANNGLGGLNGGIDSKNIPLYLPGLLLGKMAATPVCTAPAYWLAVKESTSNRFWVTPTYSLSALGVISDAGTPVLLPDGEGNFTGQMKFSHTGDLLVNTLPASGGFDLLRFNTVSGTVSDYLTVLLPELDDARGVEFSPDDRFLYVATPLRVYQFDLTSGDAATVANSRVLLAESPAPRFGALQLGPNGKIYVATGASAPAAALDVIVAPNQAGQNCQYLPDGQPLGAGRVGLGLPNFMQQIVQPLPPLHIQGPDSLCGLPAQGSWTTGYPDQCGFLAGFEAEIAGVAVQGNAGVLSAQFDQSGEYQLVVRATYECGTVVDTLRITVIDNPAPSLDLGPDIEVCENGVFTLNAGSGFARYRWQDGTADSVLTTSFPGKYWVTVWDDCGNAQTDTLNILVDPGTSLDLGPDRTVCRLPGTTFERPTVFPAWTWSPADPLGCDTCAIVSVHPVGTTEFVVSARNAQGCLSTDTVRVTAETGMATLDTLVCAGTLFEYLGAAFPATDTTFLLALLTPDSCDLELLVAVSTLPAPQLTLPPDTTLKIGALLPIQSLASGSGALQYAWMPPEGISCTDCPAPVADAQASIAYTLVVTDANGCTASDEIRLTVVDTCAVRAPTAFTPDDDGTNDTFFLLTDPCVRTLRTFRVFTRWGEEVFRQENMPPNQAAQGWDGRVRGRDFPADVLIWTAEVLYFDGRMQRFSGEVTLLR